MKEIAFTLLLVIGVALVWAGCASAREARRRDGQPRPWIAAPDTAGWTWGVTARNGEELHACCKAWSLPDTALLRYLQVRVEFAANAAPEMYVRDEQSGRVYWRVNLNSVDYEVSSQSFASEQAARRNYELVRAAVMAHPDPLLVH